MRNFGRGLKDQSRSMSDHYFLTNLTRVFSLAEAGNGWRQAHSIPILISTSEPDEHRLNARTLFIAMDLYLLCE